MAVCGLHWRVFVSVCVCESGCVCLRMGCICLYFKQVFITKKTLLFVLDFGVAHTDREDKTEKRRQDETETWARLRPKHGGLA